jgi:type II secretory pathway component GspD/PulD (secretin)
MNLGTYDFNRQLEIPKMTNNRLKWFGVICFLAMALMHSFDSRAQEPGPSQDPIILRIVKLEHADAAQLAAALKPFLSPQGRIMVYAPTNSLIIKDRQSIVTDLIRVITGRLEP